MTILQVSVATADEARAAIAAGATAIVAARSGPSLAPLSAADLSAIVAAADGEAEVAAFGGDLAPDGLAELVATAADALVLPIPAGDTGAALLSQAGRSLATKVKLVAAFSPEAGPDFELVPVAAMAGFYGVWLAAPETAGGLLDAVELADIARFVAAARRARLTVGLAGGLRVVDVGTLLPLRPDHLAFRAAVSEDEDPARTLDPARVRAVAAAFAIHSARPAPEA